MADKSYILSEAMPLDLHNVTRKMCQSAFLLFGVVLACSGGSKLFQDRPRNHVIGAPTLHIKRQQLDEIFTLADSRADVQSQQSLKLFCVALYAEKS